MLSSADRIVYSPKNTEDPQTCVYGRDHGARSLPPIVNTPHAVQRPETVMVSVVFMLYE